MKVKRKNRGQVRQFNRIPEQTSPAPEQTSPAPEQISPAPDNASNVEPIEDRSGGELEGNTDLSTVSLDLDQLPSKGLSYRSKMPSPSITYRMYSYGEVLKSSDSKMSEEQKIKFVLRGIETNFNKRDITLSDFLYIALLRQISGLGSEKFIAVCACPKCKGRDKYPIETESFDYNDLFDDIDPSEKPELPIVVDLFGGIDHVFMPVTVGDYLDLIEMGKENDEIAMHVMQCVNRDEIYEDFDDVYDKFYRANIEDGQYLEKVNDFLHHGLKPFEIKCTVKISEEDSEEGSKEKLCDYRYPVELDGGQALLLPFRESKSPKRDRIRFGNKKCG